MKDKIRIYDILNTIEVYGKLTPDAIDDLNYIRDYITNLQEDNAELRNEVKELERMCELYGKSIYNAELIDYKSRNEKAKSLTNRTIEIIKQQPSGNDEWILERLNGINYCLGSDE